jgi:hypothetical protein
MKQFGTTHMKQRFCKCCVPMDSPRSKVKAETEKLIREELNTPEKPECLVCGDRSSFVCSECC